MRKQHQPVTINEAASEVAAESTVGWRSRPVAERIAVVVPMVLGSALLLLGIFLVVIENQDGTTDAGHGNNFAAAVQSRYGAVPADSRTLSDMSDGDRLPFRFTDGTVRLCEVHVADKPQGALLFCNPGDQEAPVARH